MSFTNLIVILATGIVLLFLMFNDTARKIAAFCIVVAMGGAILVYASQNQADHSPPVVRYQSTPN